MAILITGAASSAAYRLERMLNTSDVIFGDKTDLPPVPGKKFLPIPAAFSNTYAHEILACCLDNNISSVYPLHRVEVIELQKTRQLFYEYGISLIIPSDKWLENNLNIPPFSSSNILVLENGKVKAFGPESPPSNLPDEENGIFTWIREGDRIIYAMFVIENAKI